MPTPDGKVHETWPNVLEAEWLILVQAVPPTMTTAPEAPKLLPVTVMVVPPAREQSAVMTLDEELGQPVTEEIEGDA